MGALAALGAIVVLVLAIMAIIYVVKKGATCPQCPPGPASVSFWTLPDGAAVPTGISCQTGAITVQNADYGAPWSGGASPCQWTDVTAQAGNLMNGKSSYTIPASANLVSLLGITDHCPGVVKTFGGSYTCA